MPSHLTQILTIFTVLVLIVLMFVLYIRSRQGDQRVINLTNQMLLPVLSIIVITLNVVFANHPGNPTLRVCLGWLNTLRYVGLVVVILLIVAGCIRYFVSQRRDRRHITHPVLFSVILIALVFLIEYVNYPCF
jgi:cytochrome bd-type quinol oxidase subunit 2